jgi:hypothetical protein
VPVVARAVLSRRLQHRDHAITYLGWARDRGALEALERLLSDSAEHEEIRAAALESIACITVARGDSLAAQWIHGTGALSQAASRVFDGPRCPLDERTFLDALLSRHD